MNSPGLMETNGIGAGVRRPRVTFSSTLSDVTTSVSRSRSVAPWVSEVTPTPAGNPWPKSTTQRPSGTAARKAPPRPGAIGMAMGAPGGNPVPRKTNVKLGAPLTRSCGYVPGDLARGNRDGDLRRVPVAHGKRTERCDRVEGPDLIRPRWNEWKVECAISLDRRDAASRWHGLELDLGDGGHEIARAGDVAADVHHARDGRSPHLECRHATKVSRATGVARLRGGAARRGKGRLVPDPHLVMASGTLKDRHPASP